MWSIRQERRFSSRAMLRGRSFRGSPGKKKSNTWRIAGRRDSTTIIVNLIEHQFHGPVDRYGEGPFTTPGDFSTPNEKYFEHADWVIRKAAEKGIQVFLAPIYLGYIGTNEGWVKEALANGPAKCRNWGRYVGNRYRNFDNIVWLMGGDRNPDTAREDVDAVAEGIKEMDTRHLFTAHCHPENSAMDQYAKRRMAGCEFHLHLLDRAPEASRRLQPHTRPCRSF